MVDCGLLNLASCLPGAFFNYITGILNSAIQPLLTMVQNLLSAQIDLTLFSELWAIIVYVLSMFYALLIIYAGFQFIISGYDPVKRENAKAWLRNIIIMIILIQASFFIYDLTIQLASVMTSTTLTLVNNGFFTLTANNASSGGLDIVFFLFYVVTLLLTSLILIIRYGVVAIGVVLFPMSIFFYFIEPLKPYGIIILNFLGIAAFVTFLDAILLVGFSKLVNISLFSNIQILVMIAAFLLIDILMLFLMFFSVIKAAFNVGNKISAIAGAL